MSWKDIFNKGLMLVIGLTGGIWLIIDYAKIESQEIENRLERLCIDTGFDALYVNESVTPEAYYCVELPAVGDIGLVLRISDNVVSPPKDESQPLGMNKNWIGVKS